MNRKNISKLFFKDYFKEKNGFNFNYVISNGTPDDKAKQEILRRNKEIKEVELKLIPSLNTSNACSFTMKVAYPGLVTGTGLVHDSKKLDGAYNLGMHFDYTWGMPIIYGSSVKGVLRQYFKDFYNQDKFKEEEMEDSYLFDDIFNGNHKSIYQRDIFFDAVITHSHNGHLLEDDSITPHGDDPLKNPIPITMLKIAPGCSIEFRFHLVDSIINGKIYTKSKKLKLFKEILKTVGIGAKTNVGYGHFIED